MQYSTSDYVINNTNMTALRNYEELPVTMQDDYEGKVSIFGSDNIGHCEK